MRVIKLIRQFKLIQGRSHSRKIFLSIITNKVSFGILLGRLGSGVYSNTYTLVLKAFSLVPGGDSNMKGTGMRVRGIESLKDIKGTNLGVASP